MRDHDSTVEQVDDETFNCPRLLCSAVIIDHQRRPVSHCPRPSSATCGTGTVYVSGCRALGVWIFYALEKAGLPHGEGTCMHDGPRITIKQSHGCVGRAVLDS
jgi:hypothetical protein